MPPEPAYADAGAPYAEPEPPAPEFAPTVVGDADLAWADEPEAEFDEASEEHPPWRSAPPPGASRSRRRPPSRPRPRSGRPSPPSRIPPPGHRRRPRRRSSITSRTRWPANARTMCSRRPPSSCRTPPTTTACGSSSVRRATSTSTSKSGQLRLGSVPLTDGGGAAINQKSTDLVDFRTAELARLFFHQVLNEDLGCASYFVGDGGDGGRGRPAARHRCLPAAGGAAPGADHPRDRHPRPRRPRFRLGPVGSPYRRPRPPRRRRRRGGAARRG